MYLLECIEDLAKDTQATGDKGKDFLFTAYPSQHCNM